MARPGGRRRNDTRAGRAGLPALCIRHGPAAACSRAALGGSARSLSHPSPRPPGRGRRARPRASHPASCTCSLQPSLASDRHDSCAWNRCWRWCRARSKAERVMRVVRVRPRRGQRPVPLVLFTHSRTPDALHASERLAHADTVAHGAAAAARHAGIFVIRLFFSPRRRLTVYATLEGW